MLIKPMGRTFNDDGTLPTAHQALNGPMADPICNVKSVQCLTNRSGHEDYRTEVGKWYEERREEPICSVFDFDNPQAMKWQQD